MAPHLWVLKGKAKVVTVAYEAMALLPPAHTWHNSPQGLCTSSSFHQLNSFSSQPKSFFVPEASSDPVSVEAT